MGIRARSTDGGNASGLLSFDNDRGERELTGDHAEHAFCSVWGGCTGPSFVAPGCVQILLTDLCVVRDQMQRKAEHTTMPGSPQGQGQTNNPTRNITFKGKERSQAEGNPERQWRGSIPLFSISWWLSVLQSQGSLNWFSSSSSS